MAQWSRPVIYATPALPEKEGTMLKGTKTYLLVAVAIGVALFAFVTEGINIFLLFEAIFAVLAIGATRAGVKKIEIATDLVPPGWAEKAGITLPNIKTHLSVAALVLTAVLAFMAGEQGLILTGFIVAAALGVSSLRAALNRLQRAVEKRLGVFRP